MRPNDRRPFVTSAATRPGTALSFLTAHTAADARRAAAGALPGARGVGDELVVGGDESGTAEIVELAERILASCREPDARTGRCGAHSVVAVDPEVDVLELALVIEHLAAEPDGLPPVAVNEIVAVTSVAALLALLFGAPPRGFSLAADDASEFDDGARRLAERLEFASIVVLDGLCSAPVAAVRRATGLIRVLAPGAQIVPPTRLAAALDGPRPLHRGRAHQLARSMGWQRSLAGIPEPTDTGLDSLVFRDPRPMHPVRLARVLQDEFAPGPIGRVLRGRGFVRLATRPDAVGAVSIAGQVVAIDPTGMPAWSSGAPFGQEFVLVGEGLDRDAVVELLAGCLLDEEELLAGPAAWARFGDPFPAWLDAAP